jgi:hypothetical protein
MLVMPSFPRRREPKFVANHRNLDPRLRGDDGSKAN